MVAATAVAAFSLVSGADAHPKRSTAPARCCFMVSVDASGSYQDEYRGTRSSQWSGFAGGEWEWHTRFIVEYTGHGVKAIGSEAMANGSTESAYKYDILLNPIPPSTTLRTDHRECPTGSVSSGDRTAFGPGLTYTRTSTTKLIAAAQNVNGYARALVVSLPAQLGFACSGLGGEAPGDRLHDKPGGTDLQGPDAYAVQAPSVNNFLGGKSFGRACWQKVKAHLANPFPHDYTFDTSLGVQFTYFPQDQLKGKIGALDAMQGKTPTVSAAGRRSQIDRNNGADNGSRCS